MIIFERDELEMMQIAIDNYTSLSDARAMSYAHLQSRLVEAIEEIDEIADFQSDCGDSCKL